MFYAIFSLLLPGLSCFGPVCVCARVVGCMSKSVCQCVCVCGGLNVFRANSLAASAFNQLTFGLLNDEAVCR